ncbi:MAG: rhodanese-like domain-containing protein [Patescibacteria group bacterium]
MVILDTDSDEADYYLFMPKKSLGYYYIFVFVALFFISAQPVKAVPPPDFIFSVTTQIAQFFTISFLLLSTASSAIFQFLSRRLAGRQRVLYWIAVGMAVIVISGVGAWLYGRYAQKQALNDWMIQSKQYQQSSFSSSSTSLTELNVESIPIPFIDQEPASIGFNSDDDLDQLVLGNDTSFVAATLQSDDAITQFIHRYYNAIATRQFLDAYTMSKQSVSFDTFISWYASTTAISIDKLQRIDDNSSSLELTLTEGAMLTRYGVLMDVRLDDSGQPVQVERSIVRILNQLVLGSKVDDRPQQVTTQQYFEEQQQTSESVSNVDFKAAINNSQKKYLVLDARENIEFENGHFPDATHIRFADLKAGRWIELPTDRPVYVFCWSGIRGKEVTEFLRSKKILARYLETGANGWVAANGKWVGDVAFLKVYTDDRYKRVFSLDELKDNLAKGIVLVDTRPPNSYNAWHISGSINIPLMSTPSISVEQTFSRVPAHSTVITVCDDYVNCFDAKLTGVELERRGHTFLGRFAEPWRLKP